ncbi:MAG: prepilin-type N-terminal cleavage/methylation domain-containing protein [Lysobacteraceae bacterium]
MTNFDFRDAHHKMRAANLFARNESGVTLVELMVGLALLAILAVLAIPSFSEFQQRTTLRGVIEQFSSALTEVRNEAVKENVVKAVDFTTITLPAGVSRSAFSMTSSDGNGTVRINPRDGMLTTDSRAGNVVLTLGNYQLRFNVTALGRSSVCAPAGHSVTGYKDCAP